MAQLEISDGSAFMRPFAIGMTAYLVVYNILFMATRGAFQSLDPVSDVYFFVLAAYAAAPEVKRWRQAQAEDPDDWKERLRKGGPLITLWFLLWAAAVIVRIWDPTLPMPPELKAINMQVMGLFFGAYAIRQVRKRSVLSARGSRAAGPAGLSAADDVVEFLKSKGSASPKEILEAVDVSRRTLTRLLAALLKQGRIVRDAESATDPTPTYRAL